MKAWRIGKRHPIYQRRLGGQGIPDYGRRRHREALETGLGNLRENFLHYSNNTRDFTTRVVEEC